MEKKSCQEDSIEQKNIEHVYMQPKRNAHVRIGNSFQANIPNANAYTNTNNNIYNCNHLKKKNNSNVSNNDNNINGNKQSITQTLKNVNLNGNIIFNQEIDEDRPSSKKRRIENEKADN